MPDRRLTPFDDLEPTAVLRPADIAERLGVDARSVRRAIGRGELAASRACGLRVLAADAAAWWAAGRVDVRSRLQPTGVERARAPEPPTPALRHFRHGVPAARLPLPPRPEARP